MERLRLDRRFDRVWTQALRLVEKFLKFHLDTLKTGSGPPEPPPIRDIHVAVQCLKRIYDGRLAISLGEKDALESKGSDAPADAAAQEVSRRVRELLESADADSDDDDSL